ncbi:MAG: TetR/AcrR family transcriptional regulator [Pseudomonadota bacterium]|uniref:TetR/AcrR family transcriptional regulator n=1 Tax=Candidatus Desulfatibia profunda TaxID=2841695 RepID=A0A8J6TL78_9BACT|nr:TetR/AcrR family transcriptional regulator [Candidatus Desulfatibia profunda]MBL7179178.1 TetR/AcrR family transcriptional regulator [Desulfobacterales bacterium]
MTLKEKIIHEALRQFSFKGFLSTSITDILEAVGTSKGGLYNHFKSKEELFFAAMSEARKIWRQRNLDGLEQMERPIEKIKKLLENYRDKYLADSENFPGGCIFVTLAVELNDQRPHLAREMNDGFIRFKRMLKRLLDQEKKAGTLREGIDTAQVAEMVFSGILGTSVMYISDKSMATLDRNIRALSDYLTMISR